MVCAMTHIYCQRLTGVAFTRDAIRNELRPFDDVLRKHESKFLGDPRPELDEAWGGLLHGMTPLYNAHNKS